MKYYTLYLDETNVEKIRKIGEAEKRSLSNYINFTLEQHLNAFEKGKGSGGKN